MSEPPAAGTPRSMDAPTARTQLTEERENLVRLATRARDDAPEPSPEEEGALGAHPADVASDVEERMDDEGLAADADRQVADIDAALARIDDGTWGTCTVCGKAIDDERLDARPQADRCREHAA